MALAKVLVADKIHEDGLKLLQEFAEVEVATGLKPEELVERVGDKNVIVVRSATKVTNDVVAAGKQLKIIARAGVGLDNIDVEAAKCRNIKVINAPEAPAVAVAELVFAYMLTFARHILRADSGTKQGKWEKKELMGTELRDKTLGIVGTGHIGQKVGYMGAAFKMNLLFHDIVQNEELAKRTGGKYVDLKTLLQESDYITLHVPLLPETKHIVGNAELKLMKPTAVLINTSRGAIVDEKALIEVLQDKKIGGACLDVYENEPLRESPLFDLPNVILTPHIGASTVEAQREAAIIIAKKIKDTLK
ncbi:MAG TPA: hydroxyacid dehydrogenase [Hadesarchaea archaeon]|nr:hydroxyacid dehydrogenase [Hadesarchaea archaeon]